MTDRERKIQDKQSEVVSSPAPCSCTGSRKVGVESARACREVTSHKSHQRDSGTHRGRPQTTSTRLYAGGELQGIPVWAGAFWAQTEDPSGCGAASPSQGRWVLKEAIATHSSIVAWRIPWTEEPDGLQSIGSQRVGYD